MKKDSIEQMIYDETVSRLEIMEKDGYEFPSEITKLDIFAIVGATIVSLVLIMLCMIGVIN